MNRLSWRLQRPMGNGSANKTSLMFALIDPEERSSWSATTLPGRPLGNASTSLTTSRKSL